jgi:hypothetical protein
MINTVYVQISGNCADVLLYNHPDTNSEYVRNGSIYVQLDNALYGTIETAKACYDNLANYLISLAFREIRMIKAYLI